MIKTIPIWNIKTNVYRKGENVPELKSIVQTSAASKRKNRKKGMKGKSNAKEWFS